MRSARASLPSPQRFLVPRAARMLASKFSPWVAWIAASKIALPILLRPPDLIFSCGFNPRMSISSAFRGPCWATASNFISWSLLWLTRNAVSRIEGVLAPLNKTAQSCPLVADDFVFSCCDRSEFFLHHEVEKVSGRRFVL